MMTMTKSPSARALASAFGGAPPGEQPPLRHEGDRPEAQPYRPHGEAALEPAAFGALFGAPRSGAVQVEDGIARIYVDGPQGGGWFWQDYRDHVAAMRAAIAGGARAVLLVIDSPGGLVSGMLEACRELRSLADESGVRLFALVQGSAASAAYALAAAGERVFMTPTSMVGSIGVIAALADRVKANELAGVNVRLVTTGARKLDGQPDTPVTDDATRALQARVDALGAAYFAWVEERRGLTVDAIRRLEGAVFTGGGGVEARLADELVNTLPEAVAAVLRLIGGQAGETPAARVAGTGPAASAPNGDELLDALAGLPAACRAEVAELAATVVAAGHLAREHVSFYVAQAASDDGLAFLRSMADRARSSLRFASSSFTTSNAAGQPPAGLVTPPAAAPGADAIKTLSPTARAVAAAMGLDPAEYAAHLAATHGDERTAGLSLESEAMATNMGFTPAEREEFAARIASPEALTDGLESDEGEVLTDNQIRGLARVRAVTFEEQQRAEFGSLDEVLAMLSPELQAQHARAVDRSRAAGLSPVQARIARTRGLSAEAFATENGIAPTGPESKRRPLLAPGHGFDVAGALGLDPSALDSVMRPTDATPNP